MCRQGAGNGVLNLQLYTIVERCRNEDGTVDVDAYAVAIVSVLQDETVKNWLLSRG